MFIESFFKIIRKLSLRVGLLVALIIFFFGGGGGVGWWWGWALIRGWALINFCYLQGGRLFEVGTYLRLGA